MDYPKLEIAPFQHFTTPQFLAEQCRFKYRFQARSGQTVAYYFTPELRQQIFQADMVISVRVGYGGQGNALYARFSQVFWHVV
jgi:hypothetical protein